MTEFDLTKIIILFLQNAVKSSDPAIALQAQNILTLIELRKQDAPQQT